LIIADEAKADTRPQAGVQARNRAQRGA